VVVTEDGTKRTQKRNAASLNSALGQQTPEDGTPIVPVVVRIAKNHRPRLYLKIPRELERPLLLLLLCRPTTTTFLPLHPSLAWSPPLLSALSGGLKSIPLAHPGPSASTLVQFRRSCVFSALPLSATGFLYQGIHIPSTKDYFRTGLGSSPALPSLEYTSSGPGGESLITGP
jgi:hypothetical protein